jgi:acetyltransferase EpsM
LEVLCAIGSEVLGFWDEKRATQGRRFGLPVFGKLPEQHIEGGNPIALAVGDNYQRQQLLERLERKGASDVNFPSIAHPSASVSRFAKIGCGTVILQGACVGPSVDIGRFAVVATAAVLTHDAKMEDYSFLAANAVIGAATLGARSFVGTGTVVNPGSVVGVDTVVGAQSFVRGRLGDSVVAHGIPAQERRTRLPGETYLG